MRIARLNSAPEIFFSLQGEGSRVGTPAVFLRLAGCNLHCSWCDTKYSWGNAVDVPVVEIVSRIGDYGCPNLVITGGEPLLQAEDLVLLLSLLPQEIFVEVETNGSLMPHPALLERVNQWNVSPKLGHSGNESEQAICKAALGAFVACGRSWFKFVVQSESDWNAIAVLQLPQERIMLMPCAATRKALEAERPIVAGICLRHQVRMGERLHLVLWDDKKGV